MPVNYAPMTASQLIDHQEICDRLDIWCRSVDLRDFSSLTEVFVPHLVWDFGRGTVDTTLDEVVARIKAHMLGASACGARHIHVSNVRSHIMGDDAKSDAYFLAASAGCGAYLGKTLLEWGNYHDTWKRGAEGWRIVRRDYRMDIQHGPLEILYGSAPAEMWKDGDARRLDR